MSRRYWQFIVFIMAVLVEVGLSQEKNPTAWPYGGVPDSSRFAKYFISSRILLNFTKAYFDSAHFSSQAEFSGARFDTWAGFEHACFDNLAYFWYTQFDSLADFGGAQFDSLADFRHAQFHSEVYFWYNRFNNRAYFRYARFNSRANFGHARFSSLADFVGARFDSRVNFWEARFDSRVNFVVAQFNSRANFGGAQFKDKMYFNSAIINSPMDFRGAVFDSVAEVDFSLSEIKDTLFVGIPNSSQLQKYDFMRANLLEKHKEIIKPDTVIHSVWRDTTYYQQKEFNHPGAKIILFGPVALKIQLEKYKFIELYDGLDYYSKKDIISTLKDTCFSEEKQSKERFELDYIFEKSTMYQKESTSYDTYSVFHPVVWGQFIYYITMGLGYRPFILFWWILGFIIVFGGIYYFWIPEQIRQYIFQDKEESKSKSNLIVTSINPGKTHFWDKLDKLINCIYFSAVLLFKFRLKKDILTSFNRKMRFVIVGEYLIGLIIYIAFITLSKAGSILHTLKSLFVG